VVKHPGNDGLDVIVVGGGFGGLYAARTAAKHGLRVALVDADGHQTFQPLLYQVATGLLPVDVIDYPLREVHAVQAVTARVATIDLNACSVATEDGRVLVADRLVIATGAAVNFFGVPGADQHALPLYTDRDAEAIKARIGHLVDSQSAFDVVVVGAGATGVEVTGALGDVIGSVLPRTNPAFRGESVTIHMVDHASAPLAHMSVESQEYARKVLTEQGVVLHLGSSVASVDADGVTLGDGTRIPAGMVVWAGGLTVHLPSMSPSPTTTHGGRLVVDSSLRLPGFPDVYAIGDCAADATSPLPQLGSVAKQQGLHVGESLSLQSKGHEPKAFHYKDMGVMAMLRHDRAVVEAGGRHTQIDGITAYAMWLGLHAVLLPDDRDRLDAVHAWVHEWATDTSRFLAT
jgi:NADH dehydrogenase